MFLLSRRQTRTALAAGAGAAVYLAASEIGKDKLKLTGLFVLASASMAGMVTARASAKTYSVEKRLTAHVAATAAAVNLVDNGGTVPTINSITPGQGGFLATMSQQGHRANLNNSPDTHQGGAPASYSQSSFDNCITRVNNLIDACDAVSSRADYILNSVLTGTNIAT